MQRKKPKRVKSLLLAGHFSSEKATGLRQSARSMNSKSTCTTNTASLSRIGLTASVSRFCALLCKAGKSVDFEVKLDISVVNGWMRLECFSFDAYNETGNLAAMGCHSANGRGITPAQFWRIRSTGTGRTCDSVRSTASGSPVPRWAGRKRTKSETRCRIFWTNVSVWKWNGDSAWPSASVAWD